MSIKCMTPVQEHHLAVIRGNGETEFCLGFVAQWFVYWYSSHKSWVQSQAEVSISHSLLFFQPIYYVNILLYTV